MFEESSDSNCGQTFFAPEEASDGDLFEEALAEVKKKSTFNSPPPGEKFTQGFFPPPNTTKPSVRTLCGKKRHREAGLAR